MRKFILNLFAGLALIGALNAPPLAWGQAVPSTFAGTARALNFAYGVVANTPGLTVEAGSTAGGSYALTLANGTFTTVDGLIIAPVSITTPITVGFGANQETVTPSAVSCATPQVIDTCLVTATFTYAHSTGDIVRSGTVGLQEALNYSSGKGGGVVGLDQGWTKQGGTNALIVAAIVMPYTAIEDHRQFTPTIWYPQAAATTILAVPTTLTSTTMATQTVPAGSYTTGNYIGAVACVDLMGQEGPMSATSGNIAGSASGSWLFTAPAASTGCVGYTIYISLVSGTYTLMYKVPLTSAICTLTTLENVTPACAIANTTYGQVAANATVTALTVNTSPTGLGKTVISTTAITHGTPNGRTTYVYSPGSGLALSGITGASFPYTIGAAAATGIPSVVGTVNIPPGYMNAVGRKIRVCGYGTMSGASTATVVDINLQWDSFGQNTAGLPVVVADLETTPASAFATTVVNVSFCQTLVTTVAGAGATAGTILPQAGILAVGNTSTGISGSAGSNGTTAAVASLNLASEARLHVVYNHTTGTDGAGLILNGLTVEGL